MSVELLRGVVGAMIIAMIIIIAQIVNAIVSSKQVSQSYDTA